MAAMVGAPITATVRPALAQQDPIRLFPPLEPSPLDPQSPLAPESTPEGDDPAATPQWGDPAALTGRAAPPAAPSGAFMVEGLAAPALDAIGLVGPGAFDRTLWQGSDPDAILARLSNLPVVTQVPPLRRLTRRLLVTGSPIPARSGPGRVLAARLGRLIAMGDLDAARILVDQLPPPAADTELARAAAEVALLSGDEDAACRLAETVGVTAAAAFWGQVGVYCRLASGDRDGARLGLDLLRESDQTGDGAFFDLATAIADQAAAPPQPDLLHPSAIHVALLGLAEWPLPAEPLAGASPSVLAAAARQPALAGARPLQVIEQAFAVGAAPADQVAAWYGEQADAADVTDALARIQSGWDPATRAAAYAAVREQTDPLARAELLDATWRAAAGPERFLVAEVWAEPFSELPVDRQLAAAAPSVARALLADDLPVPAARWLSLLEAEAAQATRSRREVTDLMPLFALAGIGGGNAAPPIDASTIESWRRRAIVDGARTMRLLALLDGTGVAIATETAGSLSPAQGERPAGAPAVLPADLERAAAEGRVGAAVLYALHLLDGRPQAADPEVLVACLRALRQVGLDRDARAIALATALIDGF
jgi:hypothetical protein